MAQPSTDSGISAIEISELQQRGWKQAAGKEEGPVLAQLLFLMKIHHGMTFSAPGISGGKQLSSADSTYYTCAQDMNSWFLAMQYYFLPVHTLLAIIGALKSKASVVFSVLILFVSKYIVELTEMLV